MDRRYWKLIASVMLIGLLVCVVTYADKSCEKKKMEIPAAVKEAIMKIYPKATIEEAEMVKIFKAYEAELKQDGQESEVKVAPDGTVIAVEKKVTKESVPGAVAKAISKEAEGAKVREIEQKITQAELKVVKLDTPVTSYEAEIMKDGKVCEIKFSVEGTILEKSEWKKCEKKDGDKCKEGKEENEQKVSIDQVPSAVKETILKESGKGTIKKIEQEIKDGKTVYEAEAVIEGKEVEMKIAADGKLINKKAEEADNDDDESEK